MAKLTVLKGLPASGKSHYAKALVDETGNTARINRDDLRRMLFNGKWTPYREKLVIAVERAIARTLIGGHNHNVVIDDTNLRRNIWQGFECQNLKSEDIETHEMKTSLELCIQRDRYRGTKELGRVGRAVINRMALEAGFLSFTDEGVLNNPPIVLCDIDGTLANIDHRVQHVIKTPKDWPAFFAGISEDKPFPIVVQWVKTLYEHGFFIILLSGRGEKYAIETEDWLAKYGPPYDYIFMRRGGDHREDSIVKKEILDKLPHDRIQWAIDDRSNVLKMWRENGIRVFPVHQDRWEGIE